MKVFLTKEEVKYLYQLVEEDDEYAMFRGGDGSFFTYLLAAFDDALKSEKLEIEVTKSGGWSKK